MIQFRLALLSDCEALSTLINSAYRGESSREGWTTEEHLIGGQRTDPETLQKLFEPDAVILTAYDEQDLVGCVYLQNKKTHAYLGMLTVRPKLQAKGLGQLLLNESENWIKANWHLKKMEMTVVTRRTELIAWYVRRGYRETDRREPFPYGDEKYGSPKVFDLEFIVLEKSL